MTLARQLLLIVSLPIVAGFALAFAVNVYDSREHLARQLESHAQDTATSLGLTLSQYTAEGDLLHMESIVDAVFDRGYYREIVYAGVDGEHVITRVLPVRVDGVPPWFINALPLATPSASAAVTDGWLQAGEVRVTSHPGNAYAQLWDAARKTFWLSAGMLIITMLAIALLLRRVLNPLREVEAQAQAVTDGRYPRVERIPATRELRRVVLAMNRMSERVEAVVGEQIAQAERLRDEAWLDPVTGVGNRRAAERDIAALARWHEDHPAGTLALVELRGLESVNLEQGFAGGDRLLREAALRLRRLLGGGPGNVSRLGGALLAVVIPEMTRGAATRLAGEVVAELDPGPDDPERLPGGVAVGVTVVGAASEPGRILEQARAALRNAAHETASGWHLFEPASTAEGGELYAEAAWRELLDAAVGGTGLRLLAQPVSGTRGDGLLHREVLARVLDAAGDPVPAAVFVPMAAHLDLSAELDRAVVRAITGHMRSAPGDYAVNLCAASVKDVSFREWLEAALAAEPALAARLAFEVAEHVVAAEPAASADLAGRLRAHGARFGVDHCGAGDIALRALADVSADYAKIDGACITGLDADLEQQAYVRSLLAVGRTLELTVVAESVETDAELDAVRRLGFDAAQGYLLGRPAPL